jgi:3-phosphoshikimate 1-carboxyvinyltransferase
VAKVLRIRGRPPKFSGKIQVPPSKSYLHRALFVSALTSGGSSLTNCGSSLNDDVVATMECLKKLGTRVEVSNKNHGSIHIVRENRNEQRTISLDARASGTTARFLIPFSALSNEGVTVKIIGDESLTKRPMDSIFDSLDQLGVSSSSVNDDGRLPIVVEGGGIRGGECEIDGSVSSQFISSLLISCTKADKDTIIRIRSPKQLVSKPYILATIQVLAWFGFQVEVNKDADNNELLSFKVKGNQVVNGKKGFPVPGDMSSAASLICATIAAGGEVTLDNLGKEEFPQPDSSILSIAEKFGGKITRRGNDLFVKADRKSTPGEFTLDLGDSPDLVPPVAGLAAATGSRVKLVNVGHLRFKESDRLAILSRELNKIGVSTTEKKTSLEINNENSPGATTFRKPILLDPEKDHRMLISFTISGLSGRFGEIRVSDPDCVKKSYPDFVKDLQSVCHEKSTVSLVKTRSP